MEFESRQTASVSIDGEEIRRIREEKRLTQLYVAKVVGVTTDTVSRWENNRYPTMRRDNAIKLAEALEVPLEDILKKEPVADEITEVVESKKTRLRFVLWSLAGLFILLGLLLFWGKNSNHAPAMQADRLLPAFAAPGSRVLVRVHLSSERLLKGMILREDFPVGWKLIASEPPASGLDNEQGSARWIFRKPQMKLKVAYLLEVPKSVKIGDYVQLQGELIANPDGQRTAIQVQSVGQLEVQPLHWADCNGDQIIEDLEILEVSEVLDETGRLHLDWDLIESLWDAGGYRWESETATFVPVRKVESSLE